jgi:hypothetical protein
MSIVTPCYATFRCFFSNSFVDSFVDSIRLTVRSHCYMARQKARTPVSCVALTPTPALIDDKFRPRHLISSTPLSTTNLWAEFCAILTHLPATNSKRDVEISPTPLTPTYEIEKSPTKLVTVYTGRGHKKSSPAACDALIDDEFRPRHRTSSTPLSTTNLWAQILRDFDAFVGNQFQAQR